jgi:hypothetical protein
VCNLNALLLLEEIIEHLFTEAKDTPDDPLNDLIDLISWMQSQSEENLHLSVLTFGEIEKGIEKAPNLTKKRKLKLWVEKDLKKRFKGRIIPISSVELFNPWLNNLRLC